MCELDGASDARAEANAVIGAVHVVVHCFRTRDNMQSFVVKTLAITEGIITANWNQNVHAYVLEIPENIFRDIVDRLIISVEMPRHSTKRQMTGPGSRCVEECSASAARAIYNRFGEVRDTLGVVGAMSSVIVDKSGPAATNSDDAITFAQRANGDCPDCGIETGHVAAAGQDCDRAFSTRHAFKLK